MIDAMKGRLVQSAATRVRRIETGEIPVVGVNCYQESADSPLVTEEAEHILVVDPAVEHEQVVALRRWRDGRDADRVGAALERLRTPAATSANLGPATLHL